MKKPSCVTCNQLGRRQQKLELLSAIPLENSYIFWCTSIACHETKIVSSSLIMIPRKLNKFFFLSKVTIVSITKIEHAQQDRKGGMVCEDEHSQKEERWSSLLQLRPQFKNIGLRILWILESGGEGEDRRWQLHARLQVDSVVRPAAYVQKVLTFKPRSWQCFSSFFHYSKGIPFPLTLRGLFFCVCADAGGNESANLM